MTEGLILFKSSNINLINESRYYFNFQTIELLIKSKDKFIEKFMASQSLLDYCNWYVYCHVPFVYLSLFFIDCSVLYNATIIRWIKTFNTCWRQRYCAYSTFRWSANFSLTQTYRRSDSADGCKSSRRRRLVIWAVEMSARKKKKLRWRLDCDVFADLPGSLYHLRDDGDDDACGTRRNPIDYADERRCTTA